MAPKRIVIKDKLKPPVEISKERNDDKLGLKNIKLDYIRANEDQPRKYFSEDSIQALACSIEQQGLIEPIIVKFIAPNSYELIAGERRWRAAKLLHLEEISAICRSEDEESSSILSLIENIQREDLTVLEEAFAYKSLIDKYGYTQQELAKIVNKSRPHITNILRLLKLSEQATELLIKYDNFTMGHARALLSLSANDQISVVNKIIASNLSVRQTEDLVKKIKIPLKQRLTSDVNYQDREFLEAWRLQLLPYAQQVKVRMDSMKKIKITVECNDRQEASMIIDDIERRLNKSE